MLNSNIFCNYFVYSNFISQYQICTISSELHHIDRWMTMTGGINFATLEHFPEELWNDASELCVLAAVDDKVCGAVEDNQKVRDCHCNVHEVPPHIGIHLWISYK